MNVANALSSTVELRPISHNFDLRCTFAVIEVAESQPGLVDAQKGHLGQLWNGLTTPHEHSIQVSADTRK